MIPLLAKIIPLGFASALSPVLLALTVVLLGSKNKPKEKVLALMLGTFLVLLLLTFLGLAAGTSEGRNQDSLLDRIINFSLGGLLIFFAIKSFLNKKSSQERENRWHNQSQENILIKLVIVGFLGSISNFDGELFYLAAVKEIYQTSIGLFWKIFCNVLSMLFYLFPILFPFLVYVFWPNGADKIISPVAGVMRKYGRVITQIFFFIFGVYFILRGLGILH